MGHGLRFFSTRLLAFIYLTVMESRISHYSNSSASGRSATHQSQPVQSSSLTVSPHTDDHHANIESSTSSVLAGQTLINRQLRRELQRTLQQEEDDALNRPRAPDYGHRINGVLDIPVAIWKFQPAWAKIGTGAFLTANFIAGYTREDARNHGEFDLLRYGLCMGALTCWLGGALQRLVQEVVSNRGRLQNDEGERLARMREELCPALSSLLELTLELPIAQKCTAEERHIFEQWIYKLVETPDALIRPAHLAQRIRRLSVHLLIESGIIKSSGHHVGGENPDNARLFKAVMTFAAEQDAYCGDAAMEALEKMEKSAEELSLARQSPSRFVKELETRFIDSLTQVASAIVHNRTGRPRGEELETYKVVKSLLGQELGLKTENKYMLARQMFPISDDNLEWISHYIDEYNTRDNQVEFVVLHHQSLLEDFLNNRHPVYQHWRERVNEGYADEFLEAGKLPTAEKQIDAVTYLTEKKAKEVAEVLREYMHCLIPQDNEKLQALEHRLKKAYPESQAE